MAHLTITLPRQVEQGAIRRLNYSNDIVTTDGGREVRIARWAQPLRHYEISFPAAVRTDAIYLAVISLYNASLGGLHSFNFTDWTDSGTVVPVRFDTPLVITGLDINHDHIDTLTLIEVRV